MFRAGDKVAYDSGGLVFEATIDNVSYTRIADELTEYVKFTVTKSSAKTGYCQGSTQECLAKYLTLVKHAEVTNRQELRDFINAY